MPAYTAVGLPASIGDSGFFLGFKLCVNVEFAQVKSGTSNRDSLHRSPCPVQRGFYLWRRNILPHLENTARGLDTVSGTPPGDEGARQGGIREIDREGVIQHAACAGRRHRPSVCAAIFVEPYFDPIEQRAEPIRWDADADAHRKASFSLGDHEGGARSHRDVPILFSESFRTSPSGNPASLEPDASLGYAPKRVAVITRDRCILANFSAARRPRSQRFGRKGLAVQ